MKLVFMMKRKKTEKNQVLAAPSDICLILVGTRSTTDTDLIQNELLERNAA